MPSFDVVSRTDMQEVANAVSGVMREINQRFDFKGSNSSLELKPKEEEIIILADDDLKLKQVQELLRGYISRRNLEVSCLNFGKEERASGNMVRQTVKIKQGIDQETAKKIVKNIKDSKMKVQCAIQGEEIRISGKKKDELQEAISFIKKLGIQQPLQFLNFRD